MRRFINPLLLWAAHSEHADLIRQIQYLKVENEVLRARLPKKINTTPKERERLLKYARPVGRAINHLVSIVKPITIRSWLNADRWGRGLRPRKRPHPPGRPRTPQELEQLILRIARETNWGYTRILGELKKLGMRAICRSTVVNILRRNGLDPSPHRKKALWDTFIKRHTHTLWACDLLQRKVLTLLGWRYIWVLVFINVKTRQAWISPSTFYPHCHWTGQQAEGFMRSVEGSPLCPTMVIHDRDSRFGPLFQAKLRGCGTDSYSLPFRSPNLNAYVERFIQTLQQECLDHFLVFGTRHMDYLLREYVEHYHTERPHQSIGNVPPAPTGPPPRSDTIDRDLIFARSRLGGLLRHYSREAA